MHVHSKRESKKCASPKPKAKMKLTWNTEQIDKDTSDSFVIP